MKLVVWGYYGFNYGDDIMLNAFIDYYSKRNIDVEIIDMFSGHLHKKIESKKVPIYNWKSSNRMNKIRKLIQITNKNVINVWGGGTIFTDEEGDGNYKIFKLISLLGGNIGYLGVGISSLNKKDRLIKTQKLLDKSKIVTFRDSRSYEKGKVLSRSEKIKKAEDLFYIYLDRNFQKSKINESEYYLITWRNLQNFIPYEEELTLMRLLAKGIKNSTLNNNNTEFKLVALDVLNDSKRCIQLLEILHNEGVSANIESTNNLDDVTKLIQEAKFHFSGRLHGSVVSEYFSIPTLSLSYSPKIDLFYKSIGSTNYINVFDKASYKSENIEYILSKRDKIDFNHLITNSYQNFVYLDSILKERRSI